MVTLSAKTWEKGVYIPLVVEVEQFYFIWPLTLILLLKMMPDSGIAIFP